MTTIRLIRHGETNWNKEGRIQGKTDIPLNETGRIQAEECAASLKHSEWDIIISSPLKRAKQTAEIINKNLHLPIMEMSAFAERNYGDAEGMHFQERDKLFPNREYPNQESRASLTARVMDGIQTIHETYPHKKVLLISHGGAINAILAVLSDGKIGSGKTKLINASMSNIYHHEDKWHIKDFNQVTHLSTYNKE